MDGSIAPRTAARTRNYMALLVVLAASGDALARDPTASLTMFQLRLYYVSSFHDRPDADQLNFVAQPVIPFQLGKQRHVARITVPFVLQAPDWGQLNQDDARESTGIGTPPNDIPTEDIDGLGDTAIVDFLVFDAPWNGRYFVAPPLLLPTAADPALGSEKWSLGPGLGGIAQAGKWMFGGLALANFSVAGKSDRDDVSTLTLQPFGSYDLGDNWSLELAELSFNYDFNSNRWTKLPLGLRVGKLVKFSERSVRFFAEAEYNAQDSRVASEWTYRFAVVPLL